MRKILRKGNRGKAVAELQSYLDLPVDGIFGENTEEVVKALQKEYSLIVDGIVGPMTWEVILTSIKTDESFSTEYGQVIHRHYLNKGEYLFNVGSPRHVIIHHTAGWENPFNVISDWNNRTGRVATEFVIGGQRVTDSNDQHDGVVLKAFPEGCNGFHVGIKAKTIEEHVLNTQAVGIELTSFGYLTDDGRTYVNNSADPKQIVQLRSKFRGYKNWHKYSNKQIEELRKLLLYIADRDNLNVREGLPELIRKYGPNKAFEFNVEAAQGKIKGLLSHSNVRKDKFDCFPQPELVDMLLNL